MYDITFVFELVSYCYILHELNIIYHIHRIDLFYFSKNRRFYKSSF